MRDTEAAADPPAWTPSAARTFAWTLLVGAIVGGCCGLLIAPPRGAAFEARLPWTGAPPAERDWPRPARPGESAHLERRHAGVELVVTAGSAGSARALVRAFAAGGALDPAPLAARYAGTRADWRLERSPEPLPAHTPAAGLAARLIARANWGLDLADALPPSASEQVVPEPTPPEELVDAWQEVRRAALAADAASLEVALGRTQALEARWFADTEAWTGWRPVARAAAWARWQRVRAEGLLDLAQRALAGEPAFERRLAHVLANDLVVDLDAGAGDPWRAFVTPPARPVRPLVRPLVSAWWPPLASGAGAGLLLAALLALAGARRSGAPRRVRVLHEARAAADPAAPGPRLHVVSGSTPSAVLRTLLDLAARRIALGERVLLVDGSSRLHLHERLGRDARWGLLECLAADMPVLGLVQYAGHPGLYLLPYGNAERAVGWSSLGRKLDEVVPHFGRIVLALDPQAPAEIGDALRGRAMEGWWAGTDARAAAASDRATTRFGIVFHGLDLGAVTEPSLEGLAARVGGLRPPGPAPEPAPITARAVPRARGALRAPPAPIVLDCDLQVLQRLRFLAWTRRVQAENRRAGLQPTS